MKCEEVKTTLPLFLYGELSFEEEEKLEVHIDECDACRVALAREKALFQSLDAAEMAPSQELLDQCRAELRQQLTHVKPDRDGFWDKVRQGFTIHFHFAPGLAQPVGAVAMLIVGFMAARMLPPSLLGPFQSAGMAGDPGSSRVRYVEPVGAGKVQIVVDETRQRVLSGNIDDQAIQRLLLTAAKDPSDAGLRVESVDLLRSNPQSAEVRSALLYAVQHDPNSGVRLKALDGLKEFANDPETRQALTQVLLKDDNPGVRTQVIDLLMLHRSDKMVGVLQELMGKEDNGYIRMRCQKALHEMNASVETY
ncbi:MAG TPA: HEAT repeat domain-containing protein [Bryobacteraceae bacterium]|nr:HEAT repeat domain-containing protein [Bryobacteraceae bacterium]